MTYYHYDPVWPHGIPRSEPPYSYEYVKDLRYFSLNREFFRNKFPESKNRLKNAFISENKVIYQIQWNNRLTKVYQMSFHETDEKIEDFLVWLESEL